jgi:translation initiation factor IF-3
MRQRQPFDRKILMSPEQEYTANRWIKSPSVRLIDEDGINQGVISTKAALERAQDIGLDVVTISKDADPPVVKICDLGKFIYEQKKSRKEQEKKNRENVIIVKEIQLRPAIDEHDLMVKQRNTRGFLEDNHKVKVVMRFRGREISFARNGFSLIEKFLEGVGDHKIEKAPSLTGNTIMMILAPQIKTKS